jgi:hypothetical protein
METQHVTDNKGFCKFCGLQIDTLPEEEQSEYCPDAPRAIEKRYAQDQEVRRTNRMCDLSIIKPGARGIVKESSIARYHMVYWVSERATMVMHIDQIKPAY